jgi:hypothetical protein
MRALPSSFIKRHLRCGCGTQRPGTIITAVITGKDARCHLRDGERRPAGAHGSPAAGQFGVAAIGLDQRAARIIA